VPEHRSEQLLKLPACLLWDMNVHWLDAAIFSLNAHRLRSCFKHAAHPYFFAIQITAYSFDLHLPNQVNGTCHQQPAKMDTSLPMSFNLDARAQSDTKIENSRYCAASVIVN
jgi:hypothetical protein